MIKGMYKSASGMVPRVRQQEVIANNVANVGTSGFKKDALFMRELSKAEKKFVPKRTDWEQPLVDRTYVDHTAGTFDRTDNPLDLAIDGDGFFRLLGPDGSTAITRAGTFMVNSEGFLTYPGDYLVSSESGPIQVGNGVVNITQSGLVEVDGETVGQLAVVAVEDMDKLEKIGSSLFRVPNSVDTPPVPTAVVRQGYLEASNVDIVAEMVNMMASYRAYEANAKALQTQDGTLDSLFQRVAGSGR